MVCLSIRRFDEGLDFSDHWEFEEERKLPLPRAVLILLVAIGAVVAGVVVIRPDIGSLNPFSGTENISTFENSGETRASLTILGVENNGTDEMRIILMNWEPDAIQAGSIGVEFEGDYNGNHVHGLADSLPYAGEGDYAEIMWTTNSPPENLKTAMSPANVNPGAYLEIIFHGSDAPGFKPTSLTVKDANTGVVIIQDNTLPAPTPA